MALLETAGVRKSILPQTVVFTSVRLLTEIGEWTGTAHGRPNRREGVFTA
ncbi:MAG: hypothetical protein ACLQVN_21570 [Bryobacteraceae bacterium]